MQAQLRSGSRRTSAAPSAWLRMLYADAAATATSCRRSASKYREQVDKHVQSEAVNAGRLHTLAPRGAGGGGDARRLGGDGRGGGGGQVGVVGVMGAYLKRALLAEELGAAELPSHFEVGVCGVGRGVPGGRAAAERPAVGGALFDAVAEARAAADARAAARRRRAPPLHPRRGADARARRPFGGGERAAPSGARFG